MTILIQKSLQIVIRQIWIMIAAVHLSLALSVEAQAAIVESLATTSNYSYDFSPGLPGLNGGTGSTNIFNIPGSVPGRATDIKVNYTSLTAPDASFFFLHNIQCKGYCSIGVFTTLTNIVTNTGSDTVNVRLNSNITAGHLGIVQNASTPSAGVFQFGIFETRGSNDYQLYNAMGQVSSSGASIATSDGSVFNALTSYQDPAQIGLDWQETELSALLRPLAPGETTIVTYRSVTYLSAYGLCTNVARCDGVQVAFGDPRNRGGVISAVPAGQLESLGATQPVGFVLDRGFDMAKLKLDVEIVPTVPEPGSWAMMLAGLAMTGGVLRRRRVGRAALA
ncbi:PEPxxWA-CTERM sorting domain-containing protein [Sphingomonas qilianensis]|uniref:PEPxxWA-CTERM sorting domain-containing protein n=1 Tax=Sphingomonas qilianensis TaxID=1736690 RepID=A0ABU9XRW3_9SPHN